MPKERAKKDKSIGDMEAALGLDSLEDEAAPSSKKGEGIHGAMCELHMEPPQDETAGEDLSNWLEEGGDAPEDDDGDDDGDEDSAGETVSESTSSANRPVAAACRKKPLPQACVVFVSYKL